MMSSSEYMCLESECSITKYDFFEPLYMYQIFLSAVTVFENEAVLKNTGDSVFQFLVRYDCIKSGNIK